MESSGLLLLNQDVAHGLDVPVSVVWWVYSLISTRVCVIMKSSCTKTDSGVTIDTIIRFIACDTDSCLGMWFTAADSVEPFLVTVGL